MFWKTINGQCWFLLYRTTSAYLVIPTWEYGHNNTMNTVHFTRNCSATLSSFLTIFGFPGNSSGFSGFQGIIEDPRIFRGFLQIIGFSGDSCGLSGFLGILVDCRVSCGFLRILGFLGDFRGFLGFYGILDVSPACRGFFRIPACQGPLNQL